MCASVVVVVVFGVCVVVVVVVTLCCVMCFKHTTNTTHTHNKHKLPTTMCVSACPCVSCILIKNNIVATSRKNLLIRGWGLNQITIISESDRDTNIVHESKLGTASRADI